MVANLLLFTANNSGEQREFSLLFRGGCPQRARISADLRQRAAVLSQE
jgi:hypothetical protein